MRMMSRLKNSKSGFVSALSFDHLALLCQSMCVYVRVHECVCVRVWNMSVQTSQPDLNTLNLKQWYLYMNSITFSQFQKCHKSGRLGRHTFHFVCTRVSATHKHTTFHQSISLIRSYKCSAFQNICSLKYSRPVFIDDDHHLSCIECELFEQSYSRSTKQSRTKPRGSRCSICSGKMTSSC